MRFKDMLIPMDSLLYEHTVDMESTSERVFCCVYNVCVCVQLSIVSSLAYICLVVE